MAETTTPSSARKRIRKLLLLLLAFISLCFLLAWNNLFFHKDTLTCVKEFKALGGSCYPRKVVPEWIDRLGIKKYFKPERFM